MERSEAGKKINKKNKSDKSQASKPIKKSYPKIEENRIEARGYTKYSNEQRK